MKLAFLLVAAAAPEIAWVQYHTSEVGTYYYDLGVVDRSADGKSDRVRARVAYSAETRERIKSIFGPSARVVVSSMGYLVFQCAKRTYIYESTQELDESGGAIPLPAIELTLPTLPVTTNLEPAFAAVCPHPR